MKYKGIGLRGKLRVGKDTTLKALKELSDDYVRLSFADQLKELATELSGINMFLEENKVQHRQFLINLGQTMRALDEHYWTKPIIHKANKLVEAGKIPVITDVRFKNEATALKENGFAMIHLWADEEALMQRGWDGKFDNDPSEKEMESYNGYNFFVDTSTLLPRQVALLVKDFMETTDDDKA